MEKEKFTALEMETIEFDTEDVITTSGGQDNNDPDW